MLGRAKSDLIRIQSFIQTFEKFPSPARCFSWNKLKYPRKGKMIFLLKIPSHVCQPKNNTNKRLREGVLPPFQDKYWSKYRNRSKNLPIPIFKDLGLALKMPNWIFVNFSIYQNILWIKHAIRKAFPELAIRCTCHSANRPLI